MSRSRRSLQWVAAGLIGLGLAGTGFVWLRATHSPAINYLDHRPGAEWIVYPAARMGRETTITNAVVRFRRQFVLEGTVPAAAVRASANRQAIIEVNGTRLGKTPGAQAWRETTVLDALTALRQGTNELLVTVTHDHGPPALWLRLEAGATAVATDGAWETAAVAEIWRPARLASSVSAPGPGNPMAGGPTPAAAAKRHWLWLIVLVLLASLAAWLLESKPRQAKEGTAPTRTVAASTGLWTRLWQSRRSAAIPWLLTGLWVALFINNLPVMPPLIGFDCNSHMEYVNYIQTFMRLPQPHEGWEMFQSPLYYMIAAGWLEFWGQQLPHAAAITTLRYLGMLIGIANLWFVWGSLRLLFPEQLRPANLGAILAAVLPPVVYLGHFVTNEAAAGTAASGAIFCCLHLLKQPAPSLKSYVWLGVCLGVALLTKISALLLLPAVVGTLVWKQLVQPTQRFPITIGYCFIVVAICFAMTGWMFIRNLTLYGKAMVGVWDPVLGFRWWQDPGYTTSAYFARFGEVLHQPWYAGMNGFAEGLYSTLWGDGLGGGAVDMTFFPPWNLELVALGFWLALPVTAIAVIGLVRVAGGLVYRLSPSWMFLLMILGLSALALLQMSLGSPYYCAVKSFYGLAALVPGCAIVVAGIEWGQGRRWWIGRLGAMCLLMYALNSYASFWIPRGSNAALMSHVLAHIKADEHAEVVKLTEKILQRSPAEVDARFFLVDALRQTGRWEEAKAAADRGVELNPEKPAPWISLATVLAQRDDKESARRAAHRAMELGPENFELRFRLARMNMIWGDWVGAQEAVNIGLSWYPWSSHLRQLEQQIEPNARGTQLE